MFEVMEHPVSTLPVGPAGLAPGVDLMGLLAGVDRYSLSGHGRVELLMARARLRSHVDAEQLADMVSVLAAESEALAADLAVDELHETAAAEIGAALCWTRRMAEAQLDFASTLVSDYPKVWEMLHAGLIDLARARVIVEHTIHLQAEVRDQVVGVALEKAPEQTTGLLAARIRRLAIWVTPDQARERYENGVEERRLVSEANPDGTANLSGVQLPQSRPRRQPGGSTGSPMG